MAAGGLDCGLWSSVLCAREQVGGCLGWVRAEAHMRRGRASLPICLYLSNEWEAPEVNLMDSGQEHVSLGAGEKELMIPDGDKGWQVYSCT